MPGTIAITAFPQVANRAPAKHWVNDPTVSIAFGSFRLFPMQRLLTENDQPVRLGSRAFDILLSLLEQPGTLVENEQLIVKVWPKTFVGSANIAVQISRLRRALGERHRGNRYIINIPGRGYRFIAPVKAENDLKTDPAAATQKREQTLLTHPPGRVQPFGVPPHGQQLDRCGAENCSSNGGSASDEDGFCSSCVYRQAFFHLDTAVLLKLGGDG